MLNLRPILAAAAAVSALAFSGSAAGQGLVTTPGITQSYDTRENETDAIATLKSRVERLADAKGQKDDWDVASRYAKCVVSLNEDRVRLLLDQSVEGKAERRLEFEDFLERNKGCVIAHGGVDRDFLRAAMAETIITGRNPTLPPPGDAQSVMAFIKSVKVPAMDTKNPFIAGQLLAECRVGFAPVAARALLATEPGSPAEAGALAAMKAVTPQCSSLDTAETPLTSWFERAYAAQALYHWVGYKERQG